MNKNVAAAVLMLGLLVPFAGDAAGYYRSNNSPSAFGGSKVYLTLKGGSLSLDSDGFGSDPATLTNLGFVFGGHINDHLAIEFEYTQTASSAHDQFLATDVTVSTDTIGLFLIYRTTGSFYLKGRLGYGWIDQVLDPLGTDTVYGLAGGLGAGVEFSDTFAMEVEYTVYPTADEYNTFGLAGDLTTELISLNLVFSYD